MSKKTILTAILAVVFAIGAAMPVMALPADRDINIETALSTSWFPLATIEGGDSLKYDLGLNNFGLSAMMGIKFFKDYGAYFDLEIGDATFEKAVDMLGLLNVKWVFLKFDYHSFGGNVSWKEGTPNPIPGGKEDFQSNWTTFSIMADLVKLFKVDEEMDMSIDGFHGMIAFGAFYGTIDLPFEYEIDYPNHGFGKMDVPLYGLSYILTAQDYFLFGKHTGLYIFFNGLLGGGTINSDKKAIAAMESANSLPDGTLGREKNQFTLFRLDGTIAITKTWVIGDVYLGFDIGLNLLFDAIMWQGSTANNKDETTGKSSSVVPVDTFMVNFGPTLRLHFTY